MATHTWTGAAADNDYSTAGNWTGGVPTAGGDVVIGNNAAGVSVAITAGLNQSAVAIASFRVDQSYNAIIGSGDGTTFLQLNTTGPVIYDAGTSANASLDLSTASFASLTVTMPSTNSGRLYVKGGTSTATGKYVRLRNGTLEWVSGNCSDIFVAFNNESGQGTVLDWIAGTVATANGVAAQTRIVGGVVNVYGGTLGAYAGPSITHVSGNAEVTVYDGYLSLDNVAGGTVDYRSTTTVEQLYVTNTAEVTFANDVRPKTVSLATAAGRCTVNIDNPSLTLTAGIVRIGQPTIIYPSNDRVTAIA